MQINMSEEMAKLILRILQSKEPFLYRFVEGDEDYEVTGEDALEFFRELVDSQKRGRQ